MGRRGEGSVTSSTGSGENSPYFDGLKARSTWSVEGAMTSRPRWPAASTPRNLRRAVEREMQLRRIAVIPDVFHLAHEAGVELARSYHMQEGREWIGCRHDSMRGNFLSIFKHYGNRAAVLDADFVHSGFRAHDYAGFGGGSGDRGDDFAHSALRHDLRAGLRRRSRRRDDNRDRAARSASVVRDGCREPRRRRAAPSACRRSIARRAGRRRSSG